MKTILISGFLFLALVLTTENADGQDILYMTGGTEKKVQVLSVRDQTIEYRYPGDVSGMIFYTSSTILDSLRYEQGATVIFEKHETYTKSIKRNYLGVDLFNSCFRNINISFERLSASGNTGMTAQLLINLNREDFWGVYDYWLFTSNTYLNYDPFSFLLKVGISYYPFDYTLNKTGAARIFTGGSVIIGQFKKADFDDYYMEEIYNKMAFIVSWNLGTKIFLSDQVQIKLAADLSIIPFLVFSSPEIGFTVGF